MILSWEAFEDHLRKYHPDEMSHIIACERRRMCSGLRQFLSGGRPGKS